MVKRGRLAGQTILEFVVIFGLLTALGTLLYFKLGAKNTGAIDVMQENTLTKIADDK
jgi:hypothetical protein